jgi:hypothetical protein
MHDLPSLSMALVEEKVVRWEVEDEFSDDEVIADEDFEKLTVESIPTYMTASPLVESLITRKDPHEWKGQKSTNVSWCAVCQKVIAPKSKRRPVKFSVCQKCGKPAHQKCTSQAEADCVGSNIVDPVQSHVTVGKVAPNIPAVGKRPDGTPFSLYDLLDDGQKVVLFFYPKCESLSLISFLPLNSAE